MTGIGRFISVALLTTTSAAELPSKSRQAQVSVVDATSNFSESTESAFDHQVTLTDALSFHWNDIQGNSFEGRLIHQASSIDDAPSWLGFGFYDTFSNPEAITPTTPLLAGSDGVIGIVSSGSVKKYSLDGKEVADTGGFNAMEHQTLVASSIKQHNHDNGSVSTILSFQKLLEESDFQEVRIRHSGENIFFWMVGPPGGTGLGPVSQSGALTLDLSKVKAISEQAIATSEEATTDDSSTNTSPVVVGTCGSNLDSNMDAEVQLTPDLSFHWTLNKQANPSTLSALLAYDGTGWLGFAVSPSGQMIGSSAVIGLPDEDLVQKYVLGDKEVSAVVPLERSAQTLTDTSIRQEDGKTELRFTKILDEKGGEHVITSSGLNTFLFAIGSTNVLGYHEHRGSFRIDLETCDVESHTAWTHMGVFAAHGTLAVLAWAIASPFAITVAWFRTLVPSSWIYIHVFANVLSFLFTFVAVGIAVTAVSMESNASHFSHPHHWVGLALLVAMTFQVMNGFLRPPVEKRDAYSANQYGHDDRLIKLPNTPRQMWYFTHRFTGIAMLAMGIYQIHSGLELFARNFNVASAAPWFWLYVGFFAFFLISLKVWIMLEEHKARRGMEQMANISPGNVKSSQTGYDDDQLVPVSFEASSM